jgi:hypothetical protein
MEKQKFNENRLRKYSEYLKVGNMKSKKYINKLLCSNIAAKVKEDKSLQPLFFLPILELPQIFISDWYYDENCLPIYKYNKSKETISSVIEFFGINKCIFLHLFTKGKQRVEIWGGSELSVKPTVRDLATNIDDLIEHLQYYSNINGNDLQIFLN